MADWGTDLENANNLSELRAVLSAASTWGAVRDLVRSDALPAALDRRSWDMAREMCAFIVRHLEVEQGWLNSDDGQTECRILGEECMEALEDVIYQASGDECTAHAAAAAELRGCLILLAQAGVAGAHSLDHAVVSADVDMVMALRRSQPVQAVQLRGLACELRDIAAGRLLRESTPALREEQRKRSLICQML